MRIRDPVRAPATGIAVFYYVFDLLDLDGKTCATLPLLERKRALRKAVNFPGPLRFTPHRNGDGEEFFAHACTQGWEGLIAKRADSPYRATRSRDWLKLKCAHAQELVVGGWTAPKGTRQRFGALLVGYWEGDRLRYAGKVGTGFDEATLERLGDRAGRAARSATRRSPTASCRAGATGSSPSSSRRSRFTEWTRDGRLRHPRYQGLREDKPAREVVRERPSS